MKLRLFFTLCAASFFWAACSGDDAQTRQPARADAAQSGGEGQNRGSLRALEENAADPLSLLRVPLGPQDAVLLVRNANLGFDPHEEQIIVYKKNNDTQDRIRVMVAHYDNVRDSYVVAWQTVTNVTNSSSFSLELIDLLGDHVPELLISGRNSKGEESFEVFRKTLPPQGFGIYYTRIAAVSSAGNIRVEEKKRSEAYGLLQRNDESFPIVVFEKDPASANINDLIKTSWHWNHQEAVYSRGRTEKIAGQAIAEKQLAELFSRGEREFEAFLDGPWYRVDGDAAAPGAGDIIHFDRAGRQVIFFSTGMQQIFLWKTSYRTIYRGIYLSCVNEAISTITAQLSISVSGMDSLELLVKGEEGWDGQYRRIGKELQASYISAGQKKAELSPLSLSGLYRGDNGTEIYFSSPRFTMQENGREISGGYVIFGFEGDILQLKALKDNGLVDSVRIYKLTYQEEKQGRQVLRSILLQPAELRSTGVRVKATGEIRLQQISETS